MARPKTLTITTYAYDLLYLKPNCLVIQFN